MHFSNSLCDLPPLKNHLYVFVLLIVNNSRNLNCHARIIPNRKFVVTTLTNPDRLINATARYSEIMKNTFRIYQAEIHPFSPSKVSFMCKSFFTSLLKKLSASTKTRYSSLSKPPAPRITNLWRRCRQQAASSSRTTFREKRQLPPTGDLLRQGQHTCLCDMESTVVPDTAAAFVLYSCSSGSPY